ncbi:hypothetical protein [Paraburkholderia antibiotica]|uniref:Uncharacterized protein n=1 Tax=Paraburkholderia antibiotica TaxID=2728839 RepID=A0A7X9X709_9BURK|nr:hypothetical protein [Paraburkholderia antibiotica]NML32656.1 hypothetical protein [Paraburkholderia antibiotica]
MNSKISASRTGSRSRVQRPITLAMSILSVVRLVVDLRQLPLGKVLANLRKPYQVVFHICVDVLLS